jgi:hypothetical protein
MRASEWQYLCAVHDPPKACCAIDYCCHTLDSAANVLTSQKHFPSRMSLSAETDGSSHLQLKQLTNIFRRVYRIFAHAWFQHRDVFWKVESKTGLYVFFKTVCDVYGLIPEDNYTVPPEAEGKEPLHTEKDDTKPIIILSRGQEDDGSQPSDQTEDQTTGNQLDVANSTSTYSAVNTAKRHRQTPSADLGAILTVLEENEEDEEKKPEKAAQKTDVRLPILVKDNQKESTSSQELTAASINESGIAKETAEERPIKLEDSHDTEKLVTEVPDSKEETIKTLPAAEEPSKTVERITHNKPHVEGDTSHQNLDQTVEVKEILQGDEDEKEEPLAEETKSKD